MAITLTPEALARVGYATYAGVINRRDPLLVDRRLMPGLAMLMKRKKPVPLAVGVNGVQLKYKVQSNLGLQGWERRDVLEFSEQNIELDVNFPWSNLHEGLEMVHDDLEAMGFIIMPNGPRGKNFAKPDSESEAFRLVNYLTEAFESMLDKFDVNTDQLLWTDNSANPKLPQGFDAFWPLAVCAGMVADAGGTRGYYNLGSIGGKLRASYPDVLQHYIWLNATYGASGSLRQALTTAKREAQLRSRGRSKGGIRAILAGSTAIDKYVKFATLNGTNYTTAVTTMPNGGLKMLDIGVPDSGLHFEGIPIVHNPTFELLDLLDPSRTYKWTDSMVLFDPDSFRLGFAPGKEKFFSAPLDESDLRVSRFSVDSKLIPIPEIPNGTAVVHLAT